MAEPKGDQIIDFTADEASSCEMLEHNTNVGVVLEHLTAASLVCCEVYDLVSFGLCQRHSYPVPPPARAGPALWWARLS